MNPEDVATILDDIAERVGPLGSAAWDILVQGTWAVSLIGTSIAVLIFVGGLIFGIKFWKMASAEPKDRYGGMTDGAVFKQIIAGSVLVCSVVAGIGTFAHSAVGVIAPEFRVLENMIKAIGG